MKLKNWKFTLLWIGILLNAFGVLFIIIILKNDSLFRNDGDLERLAAGLVGVWCAGILLPILSGFIKDERISDTYTVLLLLQIVVMAAESPIALFLLAIAFGGNIGPQFG